jgi:hypothetical protein
VLAGACALQDAGAPPPNLARGRPASLLGGKGDPAGVTDGALLPEGAPAAEAAVALDGVGSAILVDLGAVEPLRALLIQAGAADVYYVEASADASAWRVAWRIAPVNGVPELRTRTTLLDRPLLARWLRIRPTTSRSPAVSELQAFEVEPAAWPRLDLTRPRSALPLWPGLTGEKVAAAHQALASLLMLVVGWSVLARLGLLRDGWARARRGALVALGAASLLAWPNLLNFHYYGAIHSWEFFHYYMGGKYLPELGYTRLYLCAAAVDAEDGIDLEGRIMRDLRDNRVVPARIELARAGECRSRFSAGRWDDFRHDARFFRAAMGEEGWAGVRRDHGFNGTPAWALLAGALARSPASWRQVHLLALLDVALLAAIFAAIGIAFGLEAACVAAGYWGVNALAPFGWTGGGFLRYDWLFWLVAGVVALRGKRPAVAGFALACSALLRLFPACAMAGLALAAATAAIAERSGRGLLRHLPFVAGAAAASLLLVAGSCLAAGRAGIWSEFADNSAKHLATETVNATGLRPFLAHRHDARLELMTDPLLPDPHASWESARAAAERDTRAAWWAAGLAFTLLLALATRGAPDWVAAVLGLGLAPLLFNLSSYYYGGLVVYATLWTLSPGTGLALSSLAWATQVIMGLWSGQDDQHAWLSLAVVIFVTGVTVAFAWRRSEPAAGGPGDAPGERA